MPIVYSLDASTPVFHSSALKPGSRNDVLIMIPGNPGLVNYYVPYLELIQTALPQFEMYGIGYLGYLPPKNNEPQTIYGVEKQIEHKYLIIKKIIEQYHHSGEFGTSGPNLYFLSHSLGSYVTQRTILRLLQDEHLTDKFQIRFNGMITPTIYDIASSDSGTAFIRLMQWRVPVVATALTISSLLAFIPTSVQKWILNNHFKDPHSDLLLDNGPGQNYALDYAVQTTFELLNNPTAINQSLHMAKEEMSVIDKSDVVNDWCFTEPQVPFKNWIFFAQSDHWVSDGTRDVLLGKYDNSGEDVVGEGGKKNLFEICQNTKKPIKHAFCINQTEEFAEITVDRMKSMCPELRS
ncbi:uncharacterized protein LODBEIA_P08320 [Lodderomyces beijingensis]|uniref:Lipid droplet-associated hydrolase n=1 Tax=Lodderomyces beijingensis TaxID=1775926 RepID=A0ABP0ZEM8_9ASCO